MFILNKQVPLKKFSQLLTSNTEKLKNKYHKDTCALYLDPQIISIFWDRLCVSLSLFLFTYTLIFSYTHICIHAHIHILGSAELLESKLQTSRSYKNI